ncbi:MAG: hypothetical protein GEU82_11985 [Luteitalea sp.]|nr:hypothetical protein [Luteitalea sp.]
MIVARFPRRVDGTRWRRSDAGGGASRAAWAYVWLLALGISTPARGQSLPSEPLVFGGGRVTLSGDVSATVSCGGGDEAAPASCREDFGFFNYTDYEHSTLHMLRLDVSAALRATRRMSVLLDVRSENGSGPRAYGLYLRLRPWLSRNVDLQVGRVPPTFGAAGRRTYPADNLLIGYPLAYQYLTSLRPDALPANADELLRMRGRGWLSSFSIGDPDADNGLPITSGSRWDTGVQVHGKGAVVEGTAAVTTGSLGNPLVGDDNAGKQVAGRVALKPLAGLIVGASAARGPYLARAAVLAAPAAATEDRSFTQTAVGGDLEYSRDYYLLRMEAIVSDWTLPLADTPVIELPLRAVALSVEGRYKLRPALYVAGRFDHLAFSTVRGTNEVAAWDAPVSRTEVGIGYAIQRNLQLKLAVQHNRRDGGRVHRLSIGAAQLLFWF